MRTWAPSLGHRDYKVYFFGQLANWFGTCTQQLALGWWAYHISGSVGWLAVVGACSQLPVLLLGPWAASLSDHVERRQGVLITQTLSLLQAAALLALYATDCGSIEAIVVCSLFLGVVNTFDTPLRQNYAAHLVPANDLSNAIAVSAAASNFARLAAPAVGGLIIAAVGEGACFAINCLSYGGILLALKSLPRQEPLSAREPGVSALRAFGHGARHAFDDPHIASGLFLGFSLSLFATPYLTLMPALAKDVFGVGPTLYGLALGASGVGAMIAGVAMAARPRLMGRAVMPWLGVLGASSLALMCAMNTLWGAMPLLALAGFGLAGAASSAHALVQNKVDPAMRGRVLGLFAMCLYGAAPIGVMFMGWAAEAWGTRVAISGGGALAVLSCLGLSAVMVARSRRDVAEGANDLPEQECELTDEQAWAASITEAVMEVSPIDI